MKTQAESEIAKPLTDERAAVFEREGYLVIEDVLTDDELRPVCDEITAAIDHFAKPLVESGVLLMTNRTPHASFDNRSDHVRWSMDIRYQSAELPTNAPITRLEGEMVGSDDGEIPPACYPPEADFLLRSRKRPGEVISDAAAFNRLRERHSRSPSPKRRRWTDAVDQ